MTSRLERCHPAYYMVRTVTDVRAHGRQRINQLCSLLNHQALDRVSIIRAPDLWAVIQHSRVKACTTAGAVLQKKIREVCHQTLLQFINTEYISVEKLLLRIFGKISTSHITELTVHVPFNIFDIGASKNGSHTLIYIVTYFPA